MVRIVAAIAVFLLVGVLAAKETHAVLREPEDMLLAEMHPAWAYMRNLGRDTLDILTISFEWPVFGVQIVASQYELGLYGTAKWRGSGGGVGMGLTYDGRVEGVGLRGGTFSRHHSEVGTLLVSRFQMLEEETPSDGEFLVKYSLMEKRGKSGRRSNRVPPYIYFRLGAAVGLGLGIRVELNMAEMIDCVSGLFGLSIFDDDLYSVKGEPARSLVHLNRKGMTHVPNFVARFEKMEDLEVNGNALTDFPAGMRSARSLGRISAENNAFARFPEVLTELPALGWLSLKGNRLIELPRTIGRMARLRAIVLDDNLLCELPPEVGSFANLRYLHLNRNRLTRLPNEIGSLASLQVLELEGNRLTHLPAAALGKLPHLWNLNLRGNPIPAAEVEALRSALPHCRIDF
jgi:hypothetical protein